MRRKRLHDRATPLQPEPVGSSLFSPGAFTRGGGAHAYGRRVSGAMDSRAAVFTSSPQFVEVYQAGTWWTGELLGWRHDASGTCQMWVRVVVGGVEEAAWIDLAALRLPEQHPAPATEPSRIDSRVKQELPPAEAISAMRGRVRPTAVAADAAIATAPATVSAPERDADPDTVTTAALPMIRDEAPLPVVDEVNADAGTSADAARRADAGTPTASVTRRSGRRRAPEVVEIQVAGAQGAEAQVAEVQVADVEDASVAVSVPAGRHRALDDEGRHRAADTEVFAAITDETDKFPAVVAEATPTAEPGRAFRQHVGTGWSVPAGRTARPEEAHGRPEVCTGRIDVEPDLLTRPMRLSDLAPQSRRPRLSGSRTGV